MTLQLSTAASGVARTAHYIVPTGQTQPIQTLLLEPQRTNLCIRSEEFDTWTTFNSPTITANSSTAPDGALTADTLANTSGSSNVGLFRAVTFTGDGEKCAAIYLKAGTAAATDLLVRDESAATNRHLVRVTWTAGVPTISTVSGTGTLYPVEALGTSGWYRILFSATGIVAANTNRLLIYPSSTAAVLGTVLAWGAQAEDAVVPSSYIKTEGTTVTRQADSLYFPFTAPPQAMTVYVRGVEQSISYSADARFVYIGDNAGANPRLFLRSAGASNRYSISRVDSVGTVTVATATQAVVRGNVAEVRGVLSTAGAISVGVVANSGTEATGGPTAGTALEGAWSGQRIYLGPPPVGNAGQFAFTHVCVAAGEQSLAAMRLAAGVTQ